MSAISPSTYRKGIVIITAPWPFYVSGKPHAGLDIVCGLGGDSDRMAAIEDCEVLLTQEGTETKSGRVEMLGLESGYTIVYKHAGNFEVKAGDIISAGDIVAKPNFTNAKWLHLHKEVYDENKQINPLEYILLIQPRIKFDWSDKADSESFQTAMYYKKHYPELFAEMLARKA